MQSLTFSELKTYAEWLKGELLQSQLQDVWTNGEVLVFEFYRSEEQFLCLDTFAGAPNLALLFQKPKIDKVKKPVSLFLSSHAKNLRIVELRLMEEKGRVLELVLSSAKKECILEIQLIPKNFNVMVQAGTAPKLDKKISWNQVRELPPAMEMETTVEGRNWLKYGQEWYAEKSGIKASSSGPIVKDPRPKNIEKKKKALETIQQSISANAAEPWKLLGESLKSSPQVPPELKSLYDQKKSRSWNMENAFAKMKSVEKKKKGTLERVAILEQEISKLEKDLEQNPHWGGTPEKVKVQSSASRLLTKSDSRARKKDFGQGFEAVIGKSAQENLSILRYAQAWDLWLHLKDFPGAHAIITRPRNKEVPLEIIREVSQWLIQQSFSGKKVSLGVKYDVVVAECRFVRPIKGDRLGRVNYQNPQVFSFASKT